MNPLFHPPQMNKPAIGAATEVCESKFIEREQQ
jgi:hypothetical protein